MGESKVIVKRSANGAEVPIGKVRKAHRKKILKSKKKTVKKKRRKKKKGKVKQKKAKKLRQSNRIVRQRFRDRNEVYQNLWKKTSKTDKCVCGPIADSTRNRIVNGEEATPHEFPWIVSMIMPDGYWFC